MKTCPSCGYKNGDGALKCEICGKDASGLKPDPAPPRNDPKKPDYDIWLLALLSLGAWVYFAYLSPAPAPKTAAAPGKAFSNEGVIYTLDKMANLKLPGAEEKAAVLAAFDSADWKVRAAGAKTAGEWLRAGSADTALLLPRLISAMNDAYPAVKKEAVMEIGLLIGLGRIKTADVPELEKKAGAFADDPYDPLKSAGYFLAAMSGFSSLKSKLEYAFRHEPLPLTRLYAGCALAGLGSEEGARSVFKAAESPDVNIRKEAVLCLSYAATPAAVPLLKKIAASDPDFDVADNAKFSLNLRKQLAIINNKPG